jgi:hypothetical protein
MTTTRSPKTSRWMHALGRFGADPVVDRWRARAAQAVILAGVTAPLTLGSSTAVAQASGLPSLPKALAKSCDLRFMPIKPTVTGPSILGNAYAVCDVPRERRASSAIRASRSPTTTRPSSQPACR